MVTCSVYGCEKRASHEVVIRTPLMSAPGFYPTCGEHVQWVRQHPENVLYIRPRGRAKVS